jgi:hypothetical protein
MNVLVLNSRNSSLKVQVIATDIDPIKQDKPTAYFGRIM